MTGVKTDDALRRERLRSPRRQHKSVLSPRSDLADCNRGTLPVSVSALCPSEAYDICTLERQEEEKSGGVFYIAHQEVQSSLVP